MANHTEPARKYCCCFKVEECGYFVAWTSLLFGLIYFLVSGYGLGLYVYNYFENGVEFRYDFTFDLIYTIHAILIMLCFRSIRKAINKRNHVALHSPIGIYVTGILVVGYRFSNFWTSSRWTLNENYSYTVAGVYGIFALLILVFLIALIRLHKHLKYANNNTLANVIRGTAPVIVIPNNSPYFVHRELPPSYRNPHIELERQVENNPYIQRQPEYNPEFVSSQRLPDYDQESQRQPEYNPDFTRPPPYSSHHTTTQPQSSFGFGDKKY